MSDELKDLLTGGEGKKDKGKLYKFLLERVGVIMKKGSSRDETLFAVSSILRDFVPAFDWVGFYHVDPEKKDELVLGPFAGKPTDHTRIPFGKGICGQSALTNQPFVAQDVLKEENYLSCSPEVKSEIVIPVMKDGNFMAQLDIDSHLLAPFDDEDQQFLEKVCNLIEKVF